MLLIFVKIKSFLIIMILIENLVNNFIFNIEKLLCKFYLFVNFVSHFYKFVNFYFWQTFFLKIKFILYFLLILTLLENIQLFLCLLLFYFIKYLIQFCWVVFFVVYNDFIFNAICYAIIIRILYVNITWAFLYFIDKILLQLKTYFISSILIL